MLKWKISPNVVARKNDYFFRWEWVSIRIYIIGGAGSGKSYTAELISKKFDIPHIDLDDIFWDSSAKEYGIKAAEYERDSKLKQIVEQPSWIIEGVYMNWVTPSLLMADKIFILNIPLVIQESRIWERYEKRKSGIIPSSKNETLESIKELIDCNYIN